MSVKAAKIDMFTPNQAQEVSFQRGEYSAPDKAEVFRAMLMMKIYGDRCVYCYFITEDGRKVRLPLWYDPRKDNSFHPKKCDTDFSYVPLHTEWVITVEVNTKNRLTWVNAEEIREE